MHQRRGRGEKLKALHGQNGFGGMDPNFMNRFSADEPFFDQPCKTGSGGEVIFGRKVTIRN